MVQSMEEPDLRAGASDRQKRSTPPDVNALLRDLGPRVRIEKRPLVLYSRAARENHPCQWLGGFDTVEQLADAAKIPWPLKGADGWTSLKEMVEVVVDLGRAHGISGLGLIEGITDYVWKLWSVGPIPVAMLGGNPLTRYIDMSREAIEMATPTSPQGQVISHLRNYGNGAIAAIELPSTPSPTYLPPPLKIRHPERHLLVFPDRAKLRDEKLGPWGEVIPVRFS